MTQTSPILFLPLIQGAQAQKHVTHNEAIAILDAVVQIAVEGQASSPPQSPAEGERWLIGAAPDGAWANATDHLAVFQNAGWVVIAPGEGWLCWRLDTEEVVVWDGASWKSALTIPDAVPQFGVGGPADAANPLTVTGPGTLLTHDGADHRLTVNKAGATETASLLFQSGWSGRAEMGLAGDEDFSVKLSANGTDWTTALRFDGATGTATGSAVQAAPDDTTPGRLMRADWGYGRGNLVGTVSQSGGVPTGAAIESGLTTNGEYVKYADGTQICFEVLTLAYEAPSQMSVVWTFPRSFAGGTPAHVGGTVNANQALANATPALDEYGAVMHSNTTSVQAKIIQFRIPGTTNFAPGDTAQFRAVAIGRWY